MESFRVQEYISRHAGVPPRSYAIDLHNRRCKCGKFQTLQYPCAHVYAVCATTNLNAKKFIDEVYMLRYTLCIWGNEFPVMPDVSNWEVPPPAFEMLLNQQLHRHPKGRPHMTRICGDMYVREMSKPEHCGVC
ncbi:hypothetical protein V6Z11_D03G022400 [Gossypium hirsutum]